MKKGDITGHLLAISEVYKYIPEGKKYGLLYIDVKCDCGREYSLYVYNIKKLKHKACKICVANKYKEEPKQPRSKDTYFKTHGESHKTKLWGVWAKIRSRLKNPKGKNSCYKGIEFYKPWDDYVTFKLWAISNGYKEGLSIDRINTVLGYYPKNCRWVDSVTQNQNQKKTKNNKTGYKGVYKLNRKVKYKNTGNKMYYTIIIYNKKRTQLNGFSTAEEAFKARVNFIENNYSGLMPLYENEEGSLLKPVTP